MRRSTDYGSDPSSEEVKEEPGLGVGQQLRCPLPSGEGMLWIGERAVRLKNEPSAIKRLSRN